MNYFVMKRPWIIFFFCLSGFPAASDSIDTFYDQDHSYITSGNIMLSAGNEQLIRLIEDYTDYNLWALRGLDGNDPVSENFIGILSGIEYFPEINSIAVIYNVNLIPPFGSKGNRMFFLIKRSGGHDESFFRNLFVLDSGSIVVKEASLELSLEEIKKNRSMLHYKARVKFSWLVDLFFDLDLYRKNIEWRIRQLVSNMDDYIIPGINNKYFTKEAEYELSSL